MEFKQGDRVYNKRTNQTGTVVEIKLLPTSTMVRVDFDGKMQMVFPNILEHVQLNEDMYSRFKSEKFDTYTKFRQLLTHTRIGGNLTNIIYSMKYGNVQFMPHQFKPVFKFLSANTQRLLIADEVGLGKTIEALYIWRELKARSDARRLLIVVPAALTDKWYNDMSNHFGISASIVGPKELEANCKNTLGLSTVGFNLIASIQSIRNKKNLKDSSPLLSLHKMFKQEVENGRKLFDLVVIDEAHSLINSKSKNFDLAKSLMSLSENVILLSATPVNNKSDDLFNLLSLMSPTEYRSKSYQFDIQYENNKKVVRLANLFEKHYNKEALPYEKAEELIDDILSTYAFRDDRYFNELKYTYKEILASDEERLKAYDKITSRFFYDSYVTRSRKKDVMDTALRVAQTASFTMTDQERRVYNDCTEWFEERLKNSDVDINLRENSETVIDKYLYQFVLLSRQREMDSCLPAAIRRWKNCLEAKYHEDIIADFDFDDYDIQNDEIDEFKTQETIPLTCKHISNVELDNLEANDSKYNELIKTLKYQIDQNSNIGIRTKIIVFAFFRGTLDYLYRRLNSDGFMVAMINGKMKREEKNNAISAFRDDDKIQILLSSEVGAEGLDMQFANTEINYDLPWNPMKLEQRIGRIDRIGQKSKKIFIINMYCKDTISDQIRISLYDKIQIFKESIGEVDEIMGVTLKHIEQNLLSSALTDAEKLEQANNEINRMCNDMRNTKALEESAGISLAFSNHILDSINQVEESNRYIRREDLINFIKDFCVQNGKGSSLERDKKDPTLWHFVFSNDDRAAYRDFAIKNNLELGFASNHDLICTFPQGQRNKGRCNIDVEHPLIKWIYSVISKTFTKTAENCFCMSISREALDKERFPENIYIFCMSKIEYEGLTKKKELLIFASGAFEKQILCKEESEYLIGQLLFNGKETTGYSGLMPSMGIKGLYEVLQACHDEIYVTMSRTNEDFKQDNTDKCNAMTVKTSNYYESKVNDFEKKIFDIGDIEELKIEKKIIEENKAKLEDAIKTLNLTPVERYEMENELQGINNSLAHITSKIRNINNFRIRIDKEKNKKESELKSIQEKAIPNLIETEFAVGLVFVE